MIDRLKLWWTYRKAQRLIAKRQRSSRKRETIKVYRAWGEWYDDNGPRR